MGKRLTDILNKYLQPFFGNLGQINWAFFILLIGAVNVKLYVKAAVCIGYFFYLLYKKIPLERKLYGVSVFYCFMALYSIVSAFMHHSLQREGYWLGFLYGIIQWLIPGILFYLFYVTVINTKKEVFEKTVSLFFTLNVVVSIVQLASMMIASRSMMPYWVFDKADYFGVSTGDHLHGVFGSNSITNAAICSLGSIFFLYRHKITKALLCLFVMLLCTSNITLFFFIFILLVMVFTVKKYPLRNQVVLFLLSTVIIYPVLSPGNLKYMNTVYKKIFLTHEQSPNFNNQYLNSMDAWSRSELRDKHKQINGTVINPNYISELKVLRQNGTVPLVLHSSVLLDQDSVKKCFYNMYYLSTSRTPLVHYAKPAKLFSMKQTVNYLSSDWAHCVFGAGMGNFSSKLAIKMTGLGLQGTYPEKYVYADTPFVKFHLFSILYCISQPVALHSALNMPNSVYNQIAGEYGMIGIFIFIFLYIGFWWKNRKELGYGKYLIVLLFMFLGIEYWFEMISFTVIFELLMLMDMHLYNKENGATTISGDGSDARI
ncbi:MAG: hypothetical protein WCG87_01115 [Bacteroidota bacterium]